ncbi:MAG: flippase-like domain-containing protein [Solirubrobacteraceae bacterium]
MTRIALVSPYSWTYPGGVTRHIEALARRFLALGHEVRVLAPTDPDDRLSRWLHRGAAPEPRSLPDYVVPLGRTVGLPANGAVSNLSLTPYGVSTMRRELRHGGFDVVHLHEPVAPALCWDALVSTRAPLVGTFHCYSENPVSNNLANLIGARRMLNHLRVRIAVSEAAAWTGRRFYGGHYRVIPNGVAVDWPPPPDRLGDRRELRIAFVGQAVERKGLAVLLRAFEALREQVPARLQVVGATEEEVRPLLLDTRGVEVLGKVADERKRQALEDADVLCAPSLGGESFGMVLTEAFAAGTPVVASDIAGYRDVVRAGRDGLLVPRGDAAALAEILHDLWVNPDRHSALAAGAAEAAGRYSWSRVAGEVLGAYDDARAVPAPAGKVRRAAVRVGALPSDGRTRAPARRLPTLEPSAAGERRPGLALARRVAIAAAGVAGLVLALLALRRIGLGEVVRALLDSSPVWVLVSLGLMASSMVLRALAWHSILRAALPGAGVKRRDAMQGTFIGVLMSATLPARLGEPSRAFVVARRTGRPRERLPAVLGTLVSQTVLNVVALVTLGVVMFSSVEMFSGSERALVAVAVAPLVVLAAVLAAPLLLEGGLRGGPAGLRRLRRRLAQARHAADGMRLGLSVFRHPRLAVAASAAQLTAWAIQWLSCYVLLVALGLDQRAGLAAAAAVLFAVNVTAALPATPSNLGVFQAACVAVLAGVYHVGSADALGYGIVLQAVELTTAVVMGMPALVAEGLSWREVRLRALAGAPVRLASREAASELLEAEA